jgi:hypothetical protein
MHHLKNLLLCSLLATTTYAAPKPAAKPVTKTAPLCCPSGLRDSYAYIGGKYTRVHFTPEGHSSFNGNLGGMQGSYEYRPKNCIYEGIKVLWRQGSADAGSSERSLLDINTEARLGYTFSFDCQNVPKLTLFSGFGWRYLSHDLTQPGESSLVFNYNEPYIPVGLFADFAVYSWFTIGTYVTWMPQVFPTVNIIPLGGARWILEHTLVNFLFEVPVAFTFCSPCWWVEELVFTLKPFVQLWQDGASTAQTIAGVISAPPSTTTPFTVLPTSLGLPQNSYVFYGIEADLGFNF